MPGNTHLIASRLNNRITFQKKESGGRNPDGSPKDPVWTDVVSTWAEVITIGGEEGRLAAQDSMTVKHRIVIRYRTDIDASMRVALRGGRTAAVKSIRDPDGRAVFLEINALERQGDV